MTTRLAVREGAGQNRDTVLGTHAAEADQQQLAGFARTEINRIITDLAQPGLTAAVYAQETAEGRAAGRLLAHLRAPAAPAPDQELREPSRPAGDLLEKIGFTA